MRGQPVLADGRVVDQAAFNHVPAEQTLESAKHEHRQVLRPFGAPDVSTPHEIDERHKENETDHATEDAVQVFQPEDALEVVERP